MSDAIARMTFYLCQAEKWTPDRNSHVGPSFHTRTDTRRRPEREVNPGLKARVLAALTKGPATSDTIARMLRRPQQEVGAKLSRLWKDGSVEREMTATSPHTGRRVMLYSVRNA